MSHQCSCGRDLNNNYVSYTNAYANANASLDREAATSGKSSSGPPRAQLTAKVMFGTVGAIKELRDKEQQQQQQQRQATRAGERRN
ncbi:uncharacterized protein LOC119548832 [Drosophila subpulchrella]|uniref:uncharacterized protein LOC119548832 n=1 Tax=Drosophila subpulchrella TaxID=1486046 RepID=UPI0018A1B115|nr:uncharacterized protein LOC119548832 [Drosophila subpulchrella]